MAKTKTTTQPNEQTLTKPPVVVILGHVDHGKTSILDNIRKSKVAEGEAGGITQHIGAYQAEHNGKAITFLDTPGHEAFTAIRSRGANVADVAILVVAADEGVKPQTKEAIAIIQKSETPFIVAINKIDKDAANPDKVKQELAEQQVFVEGYGGQVPVIELSAKAGDGINDLLDMILLVTELEELPYYPELVAQGTIIEAHKDERRGMLANAITREGTLYVGDWVVAGHAYGRVKSLENFLGKAVKEILPAQPCSILGWDVLPHVGQPFHVAKDRATAEKEALIASELGKKNIFLRENQTESNKKVCNLILRADVNSSLEAIDFVLQGIQSEEVDYKVIDYGIGDITAGDIQNARSTNASVIGFHVGLPEGIQQIAERENIYVKTFDIIYQLVEAVRERMAELLDVEIQRTPVGKLKILATFKQEGKTYIVGGRVTQGKAVRGEMIEVTRNNAIIGTGRLGQLQHDKKDVTEVAEGLECGLRFDLQKTEQRVFTINVGDVLEIYHEEKIKRSL